MSAESQGLPDDARVLHIGPHKTGTTAVQSVFHNSRELLAEHGYTYIGGKRNVNAQATVLTGTRHYGARHVDEQEWRDLLAEVEAAGTNRALLSSEEFSNCDDEAIGRVVRELGGERVHVVVTLRPLSRILASQWQQYVQGGHKLDFDGWLDATLNRPQDQAPNGHFWRRHDQGTLVRRWAEAVGPDRLTVIAVDDSDKRMLVRSFERLLGLSDGLLPDVKDDTANRSLTFGEAEMARTVSTLLKQRKWSPEVHDRYVRRAALQEMKMRHRPPKDAAIRTPAWAMEQASKLGHEFAEVIRGLDVRVIGDLERLADAPMDRAGENPPAILDAEAAAHAVLGAIAATGDHKPTKMKVENRRVRQVSTRELIGEVLTRLRRRLRRR